MESEKRPQKLTRVNFDLKPDDKAIYDQLVSQSGLTQSEYLRRLLKEEALEMRITNRIHVFAENGIVLAKKDARGNLIEIGTLDLLK